VVNYFLMNIKIDVQKRGNIVLVRNGTPAVQKHKFSQFQFIN